jgi:hypothetical protein
MEESYVPIAEVIVSMLMLSDHYAHICWTRSYLGVVAKMGANGNGRDVLADRDLNEPLPHLPNSAEKATRVKSNTLVVGHGP